MASIREQILEKVKTLLGGAGKPTGLTVHRFRTWPIERDNLPAQVIYPATSAGGAVAESVDPFDGIGNVARELRVRVESRVEVPEKTPPDSALDPLYLWAVQTLMADVTLGGLALDVQEEATSFDADEFEKVIAACATDFLVTYVTLREDPETQG